MTEPPHQGWQQAQPGYQPQPGHQPQQPRPGHQPQPGYQPPPGQQPPPGHQPQPGQQPPPGNPPQPGQLPQGGYSLPAGYVPGGQPQPFQPHPVTKRIPEDLPFVVRNSIRKRLTVWGGIVLGLASLCGCGLGGIVSTDPSGSASGFLVGAVAFAAVAVLFGGVFSLQLWIIASGGPVLAASPAGMWIKTRPTRGQAIWLPWEGIMQISRRRWSLEKMVVVKPRDPRATNNLGAYTAVDSSLLQLFYGSGFTATLNFADKPEAEIMNALGQLAAGRTAFV